MTQRIATQHTDSVLCCAAHDARKLLLSGGEDGRLCFSDLATMRTVGALARGAAAPVAAVCCGRADGGHTAWAAAGRDLLRLDLRRGLGEEAVLATYSLNADEINSVAVNDAGTWLAAGDDAGEAVVVNLAAPPDAAGRPAHRTLRRGHTNICSAVAFRPHRPWELLSGGLDCTLVRWDFSRLRPLQAWQAAAESTASGAQVCNPPMVHCLAVPRIEGREGGRVAAVGRGDGCVAVYDVEFRPPTEQARGGAGGGSKPAGRKPAKPKAPAAAGEAGASAAAPPASALLRLLGREQGGHTAAVNCVCFTNDAERPLLLSAGNDRRLLAWAWDWAPAAAGDATAAVPAAELRHAAKINWVCASDVVPAYNAYVADVSGRLVAVRL